MIFTGGVEITFMTTYQGIIVDKSLRNPAYISHIPVISEKRIGSWNLLLVEVADNELETLIEALQKQMIEIDTDCWYAHFFNDREICVIYQDRVFRCTPVKTTWTEAIAYGAKHGIPAKQLDFTPHTTNDATKFFASQP